MRPTRSAAAVIAIYWGTVAGLVAHSVTANEGHLVYALDDAYIHMAMAKNMALHGVWGVTRHEFASASSSPLWTALLALVFRLVRVSHFLPLLLNVLFGTLALLQAGRMLRMSGATPKAQFVWLLAIVFGAALPTLTLIGMEHLLHAWLALLWLELLLRSLARDAALSREDVYFAGATALLATTRFEAALLVGVGMLLVAVQRNWARAFMLGAAASIPVGIYGLWSVANGWNFLPNSVLLKGNMPAPGAFGLLKWLSGWRLAVAFAENPHMLVLVALALGVVVFSTSSRGRTMCAMFAATAVLHLAVARAGWFYRYEAYLIVIGAVALGMAIAMWRPKPSWSRMVFSRSMPAVAVLVVIAASPIAIRGWRALTTTSLGTSQIYGQQFQMAKFLNRYYPGRSVAVNDIGVVTFHADLELLDLVGLSSMEIADQISAGRSRDKLDEVARHRHVEVVLAYDWVLAEYGGPPTAWRKVAQWALVIPSALSQRDVSLFGVDAATAATLREHLREFAPELPRSAIQQFVPPDAAPE
jgi:hypothetical protein